VHQFWTGTDRLPWLWHPDMAGVPLFVSHRALAVRKSRYPRATTAYAVDSGAFTELLQHGRWTTSPEQYVAALRRYADELGPFAFAAGQDHLCAPAILDRVAAVTGRRPTVADQQQATVDNFVALRALAPDLPIIPTLQGTQVGQYVHHIAIYAAAGVDLYAEPLVGVGSIAAQTPGFIERLCTTLVAAGLTRLHGFGVKTRGLEAAAHVMASADSMAWSYAGRREPMPGCAHRSCAHCPRWALEWRRRVLAAVDAPAQMALAV
jgi:hypothetical protein